jgi:hypothetical protein
MNIVLLVFSICLGFFFTPAAAHLQPALGRFVQRDPLEYVDSGNTYVVGRSNSIRNLDPTGLAIACPVGWVSTPVPGYHPPPPNGCTVPGGGVYTPPPGFPNFTPACNEHDNCYSTCNAPKGACDDHFRDSMYAMCDAAFPNDPVNRTDCRRAALLMYTGVSLGGGGNYDAAQRLACYCAPARRRLQITLPD